MARDWRLYAQDILVCIQDIQDISQTLPSLDALRQSKRDILALERSFEIIGEAAKNLPDQVRAKHSAVPWKNIIGMRDILAHGYFSVSPVVIWDTINNDLGILKAAAETMLASSGEKES